MEIPGRRRSYSRPQRSVEMRDRQSERLVLDEFLGAVREGQGQALVVRGEPGVGKTAMLEYLAENASGCRLTRAVGVESEMELAYAGLHQLLTPMLHRLGGLPGPQSDALPSLSA